MATQNRTNSNWVELGSELLSVAVKLSRQDLGITSASDILLTAFLDHASDEQLADILESLKARLAD